MARRRLRRRKEQDCAERLLQVEEEAGHGVGRAGVERCLPSSSAAGTNTAEDWDEVFIQRANFRDANETELLTIRPTAGYTGDPPQSRQDILNHSQFRDVRAHVFAKVSSSQWVELGTIDVKRELILR